jgi:hypothetical protein
MPNRDVFITFWKDKRRQQPPMTFYALYLGGLSVYAIMVPRAGIAGRFPFLSVVGAVAYILLVPYLAMRIYWSRYDRFIRCPQCRDWLGRDSSGAWSGPNPKWKAVAETGRCTKCGTQILAEG